MSSLLCSKSIRYVSP